MSDLDLTEALRVGTERLRLAGHEPADQLAGAVLLGAAPVIERQVRLLLAAEYANEMTLAWPPGTKPDTRQQGKFQAYENAARIARGSVNTDE